ncbi:MAG TPA: serine hydrolase domain-containing protein [Humibacillus xanthopallidus]|nr:serine hydrolase domain-containing protein [Humibacillus xanthopallidus]
MTPSEHSGDAPRGSVAPGFEPVRDVFHDVVTRQRGTGAAVAIWHDGRWVADLWGGWADAGRTRPWQRDSIVMPYSVTKAFTAMAALVLVDRGLLDLDGAVQQHWPQLRTPATVRQLLSHQVGLVALADPAPPELLLDWDGLCSRLAGQEPLWTSGTAIGESALFYGHLVGELVRRVDGRPLGTFLRDEVCAPAALDFHIGLDDQTQARAVDLTEVDSLVAGLGGDDRPALLRQALLNPPGALVQDTVNSSALRRALVPAINGHGTARAVAGLYAALLAGRVISPSLRDEAATAQAHGIDRVMGGPERAWGLGFGVDDEGFGMGGIGGSAGWASTRDEYAFAFVTGTMGDHDRSDAVETAFRDVLGLPPL